MILSFKTHFPWGPPTRFEDKILSGNKRHTIRRSSRKKNRWRAGMKIHFATRVRSKDYNHFAMGVCSGVQEIVIAPHPDYWPTTPPAEILLDGEFLTPDQTMDLILSDGFDTARDFLKWFDKPFTGRLIHWEQPVQPTQTQKE